MTEERRTDIRNVAIIAHVDHGKTTLVDGLLAQSGSLQSRGEQQDCILDSNDQERERGITILSKICAVDWGDVRVNIIDTPGHADFGGEVERVVRMADGCLLLVDAFEGAMPQTRYVLRKALENGLKPIVVVNKVDKDGATPEAVVDSVFDLMVELGAEDWQLDFPIVYGSGRQGWMVRDLENDEPKDLSCLFDVIVSEIPGPPIEAQAPLQLQVANLDYNDFVGRIAIGRISAGTISAGEQVVLVKGEDGVPHKARALQLHRPKSLGREEVQIAHAGDIIQITGLEGVDISDTICDPEHPRALPPIPIDEPTIRMTFGVTTSPLSSKEGKPLQSRELKARLDKECERNVALRVEETEQPDVYLVSGRGLLHLSVLIESMRREGSELQVGPPRVIYKEDSHGKRLEPVEEAVIDVPEEFASKVMNLFLERRGELVNMGTNGSLQHLEFTIPSRGLIGLRTQLLTATQGEGTLNTVFKEYQPYRGDLVASRNGVMISMGEGEAVAFALWNLEERGELFIGPNHPLYEGQIIGLNSKDTDLNVNATKAKKLTNVRSSGNDDAIKLTPPRRMTLEESLEFIDQDEVVEVTPQNIRLRKALLKEVDRKRASRG
ncbi:MAG: translational GTPase TypA [Planctomycetota bacterium]|jgi:GTP-binding protein